MRESGLKKRLTRTFGLQAAAISVATVVGIYLAGVILEEVLITQALNQEAEYFWEHYRADPDFAIPDTHNLTGYLAPVGDNSPLPERLRGLAEGFHDQHEAPGFSTVHVSVNGDERLFLVFDGEQVSELALWFGFLPLTLVLLVLYLSVWKGYRVAQSAISPITALAEAVNRLDPDSPDPNTFLTEQIRSVADDEVRILSSALAGFAERLRAFVDRERHFTRDASHELRTPLTVIGVATDVLLARPDLNEGARRDIQRIKRSTRDMEELVEAFLLLAREAEQGLTADSVCVNDIVDEELERLRLVARDKPVAIEHEAQCRLTITAPPRVVAVMLGNLLRNAMTYTESGTVRVRIDAGGVTIEDSGVGMEPEQVSHAFDPYFRGTGKAGGHGIGLSIVRRFSDRFDWPVSIDSTPNVGTRVRVSFPKAKATNIE
jgi:signal transduction histidine kinase